MLSATALADTPSQMGARSARGLATDEVSALLELVVIEPTAPVPAEMIRL